MIGSSRAGQAGHGRWTGASFPSCHNSSHLETLAGICAIDAEGVELGRIDTTTLGTHRCFKDLVCIQTGVRIMCVREGVKE